MVSSGSKTGRKAIEVYFDFASPYAYFALEPLVEIAQQSQLDLLLKPILLWAIRQQHDLKPVTEDRVKWDYMLKDFTRSAAFYNVPFHLPDPLTISTHLAARAFYGLENISEHKAQKFAKVVFRAFFAERKDITDHALLSSLAIESGCDPSESEGVLRNGRDALEAINQDASARGVWGAPFIFVGDEAFFGVDRLPQLKWHLSPRHN